MKARDLELISEARAAGNGRGRELREAARLTQGEIAATISTRKHPVTRSAVAMYESGARIPSGPRALAYGQLLRVLEQQARAASPGPEMVAGCA